MSSITLLFSLIISSRHLISSSVSAPDYTAFVYRACSSRSFSDESKIKLISSLLGYLTPASAHSSFYKKTITSSGTSITGLFQCREDLNGNDCHGCVAELVNNLSCGQSLAARVQLMGCRVEYTFSQFPNISGDDMIYKSCGSKNIAGTGFEELRDSAFQETEKGADSGHTFFVHEFKNMFVLAQCDGDLAAVDCGECVRIAVQRAEVECGRAISGQVYLYKCYISYRYYPNGVNLNPSSSFPTSPYPGTQQKMQKTVAIILGGIAGLFFLVVLLMFLKNLGKKEDL